MKLEDLTGEDVFRAYCDMSHMQTEKYLDNHYGQKSTPELAAYDMSDIDCAFGAINNTNPDAIVKVDWKDILFNLDAVIDEAIESFNIPDPQGKQREIGDIA